MLPLIVCLLSIRVWKGLRDAKFAWCESIVGKNKLGLSIYGPQIGLLFLYVMRNGPCVRTIPVGPQAHIFTYFKKSSTSER